MTEPIQPDQPAFGPCPANPDGDEHDFEDTGLELGPRRWRCRHCHKGQGELRAEFQETKALGNS